MKKTYIAPSQKVRELENDICQLVVDSAKSGGDVLAPEDNSWDIWGEDDVE